MSEALAQLILEVYDKYMDLEIFPVNTSIVNLDRWEIIDETIIEFGEENNSFKFSFTGARKEIRFERKSKIEIGKYSGHLNIYITKQTEFNLTKSSEIEQIIEENFNKLIELKDGKSKEIIESLCIRAENTIKETTVERNAYQDFIINIGNNYETEKKYSYVLNVYGTFPSITERVISIRIVEDEITKPFLRKIEKPLYFGKRNINTLDKIGATNIGPKYSTKYEEAIFDEFSFERQNKKAY
mgnify:FL=1